MHFLLFVAPKWEPWGCIFFVFGPLERGLAALSYKLVSKGPQVVSQWGHEVPQMEQNGARWVPNGERLPSAPGRRLSSRGGGGTTSDVPALKKPPELFSRGPTSGQTYVRVVNFHLSPKHGSHSETAPESTLGAVFRI